MLIPLLTTLAAISRDMIPVSHLHTFLIVTYLFLVLGTTICWIAAEHALQHARNNISSVSEVFGEWQIQESEYIVHAGFDESLIKSGVGFLEQIHIFTLAEVDATSPLLTILGKLFSPFSSILFTESSSYRLPVFKDDDSVWDFDELVYFTASKVADGGSSAHNPLTIISLSETPSQADGMTGFSHSSSGSGEGGENKKQRSEKGKERDKDEVDKGYKDNKDFSDDPDDPDDPLGDQGAGLAKIFFEISSEIQDKWNLFQTLTMHGSLTIKVLVLLYCYHIVVVLIKFTYRQHHSLGIHPIFQNVLFNSQSLHLTLSHQQILHISNFISGLLLIHNRRMPMLMLLNQRDHQILMGKKSSYYQQSQARLMA